MRMTGRRRLLAMAIFLTGGMAAAQSPQTPAPPPVPPPSGAISGVVTDGAGGQPLSDIIVQIAGGQLPQDYRTRQVTDARGRFAFINLPDGASYRITAFKFGHLDGGYGKDTGPSDALRNISIANGAWVPNLKVPIWRPSTVSGSVRDENGDPVVGVFVRALLRVQIAGREELVVGPMTVTDDRGSYRLSRLTPGRYIVQVPSVQVSVPGGTRIPESPSSDAYGAVDVDDATRLVIGRYPLPPPRRDGRAMTYPTAFHPVGSSVAEAIPVDIKFGEDRSGIDIALTPVPAVRVSGVVDAPPEVFGGLTLRLLPAGLENLGLGAEAATALVGADGSFSFVNVPAGTYVLDAPRRFNEFTFSAGSLSGGSSVGFGSSRQLPNPPPSGSWSRSGTAIDDLPGVSLTSSDFRNGEAPNYSGRTTVTVGSGNVSGISIKLSPLGTVRGRFVMEADPAKPGAKAPTGPFVTLDPTSGQPRLGTPGSRPNAATPGEFEVPSVVPGEYWVRVLAGDWIVKSVTWQGRDYTQTPINTAEDPAGVVVTLTNAVATLSGTVRLPDGSAPETALVVVFPAAAALRVNTGFTPTRLKSAVTQSNGAFLFNNLPAGEYLVAAIDRARQRTWRDPAYLTELERQASRITLSWGQAATQSLTMVGR